MSSCATPNGRKHSSPYRDRQGSRDCSCKRRSRSAARWAACWCARLAFQQWQSDVRAHSIRSRHLAENIPQRLLVGVGAVLHSIDVAPLERSPCVRPCASLTTQEPRAAKQQATSTERCQWSFDAESEITGYDIHRAEELNLVSLPFPCSLAHSLFVVRHAAALRGGGGVQRGSVYTRRYASYGYRSAAATATATAFEAGG